MNEISEISGEVLEKYKKAGRIAAEVLKSSEKFVKVGEKVLDVAELLEKKIKEEARIAFPLNISINNHAAHSTPSSDDERKFTEKDVVKVDVGTHIDGYVGDNARTIDLTGENGKLVEATREALENAISMIKNGVMSNDVGKVIGETISGYGFKPVRNLSGHLLGPYEVHSVLSIPNIHTPKGFEIKEGMVIAIEPFASTGDGIVKEDPKTEIFSYSKDIPIRNRIAKEVRDNIKEDRKTLPFCERWLVKKYQPFQLKIALRELVLSGSFKSYPILKDIKGSFVSQAEKSVLVEKDSCVILT